MECNRVYNGGEIILTLKPLATKQERIYQGVKSTINTCLLGHNYGIEIEN